MSGRIGRGLDLASAFLDRLCGWLAFAAIMVMLGSVMLQIVARYVFDAPPAWTEELARYAMIWAAMPGAAMAYYRRADPVLLRLDAKGRPWRAFAMQLVEWLAVLALCVPVFRYAPGFLVRHAGRITETLELNSAVVVAIIPVSLAVIAFHSTVRLASSFRGALTEQSQ